MGLRRVACGATKHRSAEQARALAHDLAKDSSSSLKRKPCSATSITGTQNPACTVAPASHPIGCDILPAAAGVPSSVLDKGVSIPSHMEPCCRPNAHSQCGSVCCAAHLQEGNIDALHLFCALDLSLRQLVDVPCTSIISIPTLLSGITVMLGLCTLLSMCSTWSRLWRGA